MILLGNHCLDNSHSKTTHNQHVTSSEIQDQNLNHEEGNNIFSVIASDNISLDRQNVREKNES